MTLDERLALGPLGREPFLYVLGTPNGPVYGPCIFFPWPSGRSTFPRPTLHAWLSFFRAKPALLWLWPLPGGAARARSCPRMVVSGFAAPESYHLRYCVDYINKRAEARVSGLSRARAAPVRCALCALICATAPPGRSAPRSLKRRIELKPRAQCRPRGTHHRIATSPARQR